jgi:hypothetical protein
MIAALTSGGRVLAGGSAVAGHRSPRSSEHRKNDRPNAARMPDMTPTQPPGADTCISGGLAGKSATLLGLIPARSPRLARATSGSVDIAAATPNASASAPAPSMYFAAPNAFISCHVP